MQVLVNAGKNDRYRVHFSLPLNCDRHRRGLHSIQVRSCQYYHILARKIIRDVYVVRTCNHRKDLELPLASEASNIGMILLSAEESKKNAFEGNKWMFLNTLDEKA